MPMQFEWDEEKAAVNLKKHGIPFESAIQVFLDENRIEIYDEAHSMDEDRYITIGMAAEVLTVVYTERRDTLRIISARAATRQEKVMYYGR